MITPTKLAPGRRHVVAAEQLEAVARMARGLLGTGWHDETLGMLADYCAELARQLRECPGDCGESAR